MLENVDIEFKELDKTTGKLPESFAKELIAFANTEGGELFVGISDDRTVVGVDNPDDVMTRISNVAHDSILPDIMPFLQIRTVEKEGKAVVKTTVSVGTERPYYLKTKGLSPAGVFVRRGSACIPLSETGIRQMITETSGKSFEESRSLIQGLSFNTAEAAFAKRNLDFGPEQKKTLALIGKDGLYNNLAFLLSEECKHTIKIAVFQGRDSSVFRDRKEFSGSVLKQLEDAYAFLDIHNGTKASIDGLVRKDTRDYPEQAIREALLNSIIHRDYLFSGSTIINIYEDNMEFISLGGLVSGLSLESVFLGASQSRNPGLAAVFYRLGLVESYGTGIRKIMRLYENEPAPEFKATEGVFYVKLRNRNVKPPVRRKESDKQLVYDLIRDKGEVSRKDVEMVLDSGTTKAYEYLKSFCDKGIVQQKRNGNKTTYVLSD